MHAIQNPTQPQPIKTAMLKNNYHTKILVIGFKYLIYQIFDKGKKGQ